MPFRTADGDDNGKVDDTYQEQYGDIYDKLHYTSIDNCDNAKATYRNSIDISGGIFQRFLMKDYQT